MGSNEIARHEDVPLRGGRSRRLPEFTWMLERPSFTHVNECLLVSKNKR